MLIVSPERFANESVPDNQCFYRTPGARGLVRGRSGALHLRLGARFSPRLSPDRAGPILERLPANVPVCATTATANRHRVVADVVDEARLRTSRFAGGRWDAKAPASANRGPPRRCRRTGVAGELPSQPQAEIPGKSGIVYALTIRSLDRTHRRLAPRPRHQRSKTISLSLAGTRHASRTRGALLRNDEIDALIATTALGMGYDKPDLGFVVHFHRAGHGRPLLSAGRISRAVHLQDAYGVMLSGGDDRDINDYFIEQAFPTKEEFIASPFSMHWRQSEQGPDRVWLSWKRR